MKKCCIFYYRHINRALLFIRTKPFLFETFFTSQNWHQMHSTRKTATTNNNWKLFSVKIGFNDNFVVIQNSSFHIFSLVLFLSYAVKTFHLCELFHHSIFVINCLIVCCFNFQFHSTVVLLLFLWFLGLFCVSTQKNAANMQNETWNYWAIPMRHRVIIQFILLILIRC